MNRLKLLAAALAMGLALPAEAQQKPAPVPVNIEADTMEVRDVERIAIFTGNVDALRGDTRMKSAKMIVHYAPKPGSAASGSDANAQPSAGGAFGSSEVTLIEGEGGVRIETPDQVIVGEKAVLDVRTDMLTVTGKVTVTQGKSVVKGNELVADLKKKTSQMKGGRVTGSFVPGQQGQ